MAHIILPSRRMVQPSGPVQLRPEFEKAAVWLFNGHHGNDKAVTTLGSFRATIEKSFPTTDASILAGSPGRFGIRDESGSNFVGSGFDLAAYKSYLQPSSQVAVLVVFTHILVSGHSAQVWMSSHNRYNNQYGYRFDIQTGTNNLRWWTGNAAWTWNVTATDVLTEGTRYAAMGMSIPNAGQKELQIWHGGRRVAFDNSLADFTITYSGATSDPTILGARYDGAGFSLGTTPIGPVEMIAQFGSGLSPALAQSLTLDPYQMFEPAKRRIYFTSAAAAEITGNAALVEANDTLSSAVSVTVSANAALQEANDSLTAAAATAVSASAALQEANDALASIGVVAVTGTATIQEAADTLVSGGTVTFPGVIGTAALAEANDALTSAVSVVLTGTAALSEANDALTAAGTVSITASASLLEANDTLAAEGGSASFAIAAMTERDDALTATGTVLVTGTAAISEASDVLASAATVSITATAALQEANDLLTAAGSVGTVVRTADAALQEANDTLAATAASTVSASAAIIEAGDIVVSGVTVLVTASAVLVEENDGLTSSGTALFGVFADAALQEANDTLTSAVVQKIARRIAASDALRGGIAASDAGR